MRRLKIELDVYSKTITELRKKLDAASTLAAPKAAAPGAERTSTVEQELATVRGENRELRNRLAEQEAKLLQLQKQIKEQQEQLKVCIQFMVFKENAVFGPLISDFIIFALCFRQKYVTRRQATFVN